MVILRAGNPTAPQLARPSLAVEQAAAALRTGDPADAERTLRAHLLATPRDAQANFLLAEIMRDQDRPREAILLFRQGLKEAPGAHLVRFALASLLHGQGEPHRALSELVQLPAEIRSTFDAQALEAALLGLTGDHEAEIAIYEKLVVDHPDHSALWMSLGNALKYAGRAPAAVRALRRSVKARPDYGEGWWSLANMKTVRFNTRDLVAMRKALNRQPAPEDALHLHFALGKALEDTNDYERSFRHYQAGNAIRARAFAPGQMDASAFVENTVKTFDAEVFDRLHARGSPARDPIFIVGLQRSGSTLIEQILSSHPMIEGTSELLAMQHLGNEFMRTAASAGLTLRDHLLAVDPQRLKDVGDEYLDRTRPFRLTDKPMFVDKLPANWMNLGLIRLALPNAKIVDARRHPMACGFSNFKQHYATGVAFAYSQQSIGQFYRDYLGLMRHFDRVQPGAVHRMVNERLIDDPQGEVRRLLEYIGVPFDAACLKFNLNTRAVNTPSAEQVRRPINRDGVDYWRHYEPWLGPMKQALGSALLDWA